MRHRMILLLLSAMAAGGCTREIIAYRFETPQFVPPDGLLQTRFADSRECRDEHSGKVECAEDAVEIRNAGLSLGRIGQFERCVCRGITVTGPISVSSASKLPTPLGTRPAQWFLKTRPRTPWCSNPLNGKQTSTAGPGAFRGPTRTIRTRVYGKPRAAAALSMRAF